MIIENVKPNLADAVPNKEERKAELPGKKKPHERKLKKHGHKFKKRAEKAEATSRKAKHDAKRARRAQREAERERDTVAAENALLQKRLARKDKEITDALRDDDGFIRLKERREKDG